MAQPGPRLVLAHRHDVRLLLIATLAETLRAFYLPIAQHFRSAGWRVDGLGQGIAGCAKCRAAFDQVWDVPLARNPLAPANLWKAPRAIAAAVEQNAYDLVHVSTPVAGFVTRFALRRLRRQGRPKLIYTAHGFHFHKGGAWLSNFVYRAAERLAGRWTDCLTVMNDEDRLAAQRLRLVPPERLVHIPGVGIDRNVYDPDAVPPEAVAQVRSELGLAAGQPLLLMVADFFPRKRQRDALAAFARVACRTARFAFAGSGPLLEEMRAFSRRLGIDGRVHFLGTRRDITALIRASTATILPSEREGLPRAVMESLSLAIPVIGSDIRGTSELLAGGCGILVKLGDVEALARAMDRMLDNPAEVAAMGRLGRLEMERYDLSAVLPLHERIYLDALGNRSGIAARTPLEPPR